MFTIILLFGFLSPVLGIQNVVFVILSQDNPFHQQQALKLKNDIIWQSKTLNKEPPLVHLTREDFPYVGDWTVIPIITNLTQLHGNNASWIFFLEDRTHIRLNKLVDVLQRYNHNKEIWIGHALHDKEATIIHHFAFFENPDFFKYPNVASGFAVSIPLLNSLSKRIKEDVSTVLDFSIDNSHELALFIWNKGSGHMLQHDTSLCIRDKPQCASFSLPYHVCDITLPKTSIYYAVKTCSKFHESRIPVVKRTWGKYTKNIHFFSDVRDNSIPTINLGIPNTEQGHCEKTMAILKYVDVEVQKKTNIKWVVIADDDTIISISKLHHLLTCYDSAKPVVLGERYGYNVQSLRGYNYITGGAGMVLSRVVLSNLVESDYCKCPSPNTPDDMFLGVCLAALGVAITHSSAFHQARPVDYAPGYLESSDAITFHKHWMIDPIKIYEDWFELDDELFARKNSSHRTHNEL